MANPMKYYVYQFFSGDTCVYVGKGCGRRFSAQEKRFTMYRGVIVAYFLTEQDALHHEKLLIMSLSPVENKAMNPETPEPWKYSLLPSRDSDLKQWFAVLGSKAISARVLLSKSWSVLRSHGVDIDNLLSKVGTFHGVYHGAWS